jgi:hypothetical protein
MHCNDIKHYEKCLRIVEDGATDAEGCHVISCQFEMPLAAEHIRGLSDQEMPIGPYHHTMELSETHFELGRGYCRSGPARVPFARAEVFSITFRSMSKILATIHNNAIADVLYKRHSPYYINVAEPW